MFIQFYYLLRERGLKISITEWSTLLTAMEMGLHRSSLTGFYNLCRTVLLQSEADFDRFDQVFVEFFKDVPFTEELPPELMNWLNNPSDDLKKSLEELSKYGFTDENLEDLIKKLQERLKEQDSEHNGGSYWVGTQGRSPFGNSGWHPNGLRIGGQSMHRTAMSVAGDRKFRDFRKDNTLDIRQFQMAFRTLRQLSYNADTAEKELDLDGTIRDTSDNAGTLKLRMRPPRKNTTKLLLLMDSGGSMDYYSSICSMLFQAATQSNHFKELKIYYFHNCVYEELYTEPTLHPKTKISTEWVLQNYGSEYRVIIVGDAMMNQAELWGGRFSWRTMTVAGKPGMFWLETLKNQYSHLVWLNPEPRPKTLNFWSETYLHLANVFPMYELSVEGLESAMKHLMVSR